MPHLTVLTAAGQTDGGPYPAERALEAARMAPKPPARHLYIHIPFCFHKCHYCDFYSIVDTQDRQEPFVRRLIEDLAGIAPLAAGAPLRTIFVGGGTPTLLRPDLWTTLLGRIDSLFDLSLIRADRGEFTVECNPETATSDLMHILRAGGVNRMSIGAQSFNERHLKTLERRHNPDNVPRAIELARAAGIAHQSIDLIYAVPGQSLEEWDSDLRTALSLGTTHLSCYALTYEPNTAMTARLRAGSFRAADDDLEADMFEHTLATLRAAGLDRYEVSNFAKPGDESAHNLAYWSHHQWLAAGPSASGHLWASCRRADGSWRWKNAPRLGDYLSAAGPVPPAIDVEPPDPIRAIRERLMMGLRLRDGLNSADLVDDLTAIDPASVETLVRAAEQARGDGLLTIRHDRWMPTDRGFLVADRLASNLMRAVGRA